MTEKQQKRIEDLFADDKHVEVETTWGTYQRMIAAYHEPERGDGKKLMVKLIDSLKTGVLSGLTELKKLSGRLNRRAEDILAYFDRPRTSNGPTEATDGSNTSAAQPAASGIPPTT